MKKYIIFFLAAVSASLFSETNIIDTNTNSIPCEIIENISNDTNTELIAPEKNYKEMFDNCLFKAVYDEKNIPTYTFFLSTNKKWELTNAENSEYAYEGDNSMASGFPLTSMKYYQYRGKNPMFSAGNIYQINEMIERFYFYSYTAKGAGIVNVSSFPIAVDTYTKYIFQYAKPKEFKKVFGNSVPVKFESIEESFYTNTICNTNGSFTDSENKTYNPNQCENEIRMFYEYDPIGFVNNDGSVMLYDFYIESEASKIYIPRYTGASPYAKTK